MPRVSLSTSHILRYPRYPDCEKCVHALFICKWKPHDPEGINNLPKVTQLDKRDPRFRTRWSASPVLLIIHFTLKKTGNGQMKLYGLRTWTKKLKILYFFFPWESEPIIRASYQGVRVTQENRFSNVYRYVCIYIYFYPSKNPFANKFYMKLHL